jgi:hypothetical protein
MTDLKFFVQSQMEQKKTSQSVDWSKRREKWLKELNELFKFIREALLNAKFPQDHITTTTHTLREETLGQYEAPGLVVRLPAGGSVTFTPVGSVIIGGYGRVDVTGPARERVKLIADDATEDQYEGDEIPSYKRKWAWHVYPGLQQPFRFDESGLAKLLEIVTESK